MKHTTQRFTRTMICPLAWTILLVLAMGPLGCDGLGNSPNPPGPRISPQQAYRDARAALLQAANAPHPEARTHAIEAISKTLGQEEAPVLMDALDDQYIIVQYAGAMGLGEVAYKPAEGKLVSMVQDPQVDDRVAAAAIYALHRIGNNEHASLLARILSSPDKWSRAAAATSMGKMGEPSAIKVLRAAKADESDTVADLAMVEAMARLGDERSQRSLEAFVRLPNPEVSLAAIPVFAEMESPRVNPVLSRLFSSQDHHPSIRVAAAGALAKRGEASQEAYNLCVKAVRSPAELLQEHFENKGAKYDPAEVPMLQHLGALALGNMERQSAIDLLHPLLESSNGQVRVAAAMAILKLLGHDFTPEPTAEQPANEKPLPPVRLPAGNLHSSGAIEPE